MSTANAEGYDGSEGRFSTSCRLLIPSDRLRPLGFAVGVLRIFLEKKCARCSEDLVSDWKNKDAQLQDLDQRNVTTTMTRVYDPRYPWSQEARAREQELARMHARTHTRSHART